MKKAWICAALAVLQAGFLCRAESALEPPDLERYLRWGVLRARPGFELANLGYQNNILASANNVVPDYTATVFGKLDGLMLFGSRGFFTFSQKIGYTAYLENGYQNYPIWLGHGRVTFPVSQYGFFVEGTLNRDAVRPASLFDIRPKRAENGLGVGVILEPGWRTTIEISRQRTVWGYDDPDYVDVGGQSIGEILDRTEAGNKLEAKYDLHGRTDLTLDATFGDINFEYPDALGQTKDSRAWMVMPGVAFGQGGRLTGRARAGWTRINAEDRARADFSGAVGDVQLAYKPVARTTISLNGLRRPEFNVTGGTVYVIDTRVGLGLLYYLNRIVGLEGTVSAGRVLYPSPNTSFERVDDILRYDFAVRFRMAESSMGRRVEYRLRWRTYRRRSVVESANITWGSLGLEAAVGF